MHPVGMHWKCLALYRTGGHCPGDLCPVCLCPLRSLSGESLSRGLCPGVSVQGGLCLGEGVSVQGISILKGLNPGGSLSRGWVCVVGISVQAGLCQEDLPGQRPPRGNIEPETKTSKKEHGTR